LVIRSQRIDTKANLIAFNNLLLLLQMAIIDVLKYDGPNNVLVWKWRSSSNSSREEELRYGTQLVVNQSQEACFIKGGQLLDVFGPGTHTLSSKNLPILSSLIGLAFGGDSPFKAEVYFINKAVSMDAKFGLIPFNMLEPNFKVPVPVTSRGSFALSVADSKLFLNKIVGAVPDFETRTLAQFFRGVIVETVKNAITKIAKEQKLSPLELESIVYEVGNAVRGLMANTIKEYGLELKLFNIEAIPVVDEDDRVKDIVEQYQKLMAEDAAERMRLKRRAENLEVYKLERSFDTSEKVAENMGGGLGGDGGNLIGTMVSMGMVNPLANQMGNIMQSSNPNPQHTTINNEAVFEDLKKLGELKTAGILTDQEFNDKKKELLSKIK
jgi:membrane protease subunit (stomatin/prohibitin family)